MEKVEKWIIKLKKIVGEKAIGLVYFSIFSIIAIIAMAELKLYKIQKQKIQDSYNRAFYDLVSDINNIDAEFTKLKVTSSSKYTVTSLATIYAKANKANGNLDILPLSNNTTSNVSKFLNQLSDFSYFLMHNILNGEAIESYKEQIDVLYPKVKELAIILNDIYTEINTHEIKWDELEKVGEEKIKENDLGKEVSNVNRIGKTFTEYEGIIYDGAFSNHVLTREPEFLTGENLNVEEVENILKTKLDIKTIEYMYEQDSLIPLFVFKIVTLDSNVEKIVYVTKQDGKIFQIVSDRKIEYESISIEQAKELAKNFLNKLGILNVEPTYYLFYGGTVTISFASVQSDVLIYSDLIKVKIALDNGEVLGIETNGYIYNHKERNLEHKYTIAEARERLYKDLNVTKEQLCIIPTESKNEALVFEFEGYVDDTKFLIYINANTLEEEQIYIVLEGERGISTR